MNRRARSSVVEHTLHTGGVASSILAAPTIPSSIWNGPDYWIGGTLAGSGNDLHRIRDRVVMHVQASRAQFVKSDIALSLLHEGGQFSWQEIA